LGSLLRRYTELPYVVDLLQSRELVLLSPRSWDDRNDSYYIEQYARIRNLKSTYAVCLAEAPETYHHWRVFSNGSGGACIVFKKEKLLRNIRKISGIRTGSVQYRTIRELRTKPPTPKNLPFLKRYAFIDEQEYRLFLGIPGIGPATFRCQIALSTIEKITLSPWLPKSVADNVRKTLKSIDGCSSIRIFRSTLVENEDWKRFAIKDQ
jgi:hypothetical protein